MHAHGRRKNIQAIRWAVLLAACLLGFACQKQIAKDESPPFRIVATDAGFEAPGTLAAGLRHIDDPVPKEDVVLKLFDYRFELDHELRKGVQVIRIETPGPSMHEVDIFRLHEGKTVEDLKRWRKEDEGGPAPADALGGALDSHNIKRVVWLRKEFVPGRYALHCEMPITNTKLTHADVGMALEIDIKE
jgi:hypothetical protein